jgi:hypothetical protein
MEDTIKEHDEFTRKAGEVLSIALHIETTLEFFISNYFVKPQNAKTHFFNDIFMIKSTFERKLQIFSEICKREKFNHKKIEGVIKSIRFVQETRNKVAHWQAEKMFDKPLRLRKRTTYTTKNDILELNNSLLNKLDKERLNAIRGIEDFYQKYYKDGTIDENPKKFLEVVK